MTLEEVKTSIEQKQLDDKLLIFKYTDIPFVAYQYVNEISSFKKLQIEYIEDLSTIENSVVDIFGTSDIKTGIRVYSCDEFNSMSVDLKNEKNIYVITKKISDNKVKSLFEDNIIYIPKLEDWQIKDYVYSVAEGVSRDNLDWFLSICNDIYRIDNELDKLRLFDINEQKYLFEDMKYEGSFNDLSSFNVFNITNSVTSKDMR